MKNRILLIAIVPALMTAMLFAVVLVYLSLYANNASLNFYIGSFVSISFLSLCLSIIIAKVLSQPLQQGVKALTQQLRHFHSNDAVITVTDELNELEQLITALLSTLKQSHQVTATQLSQSAIELKLTLDKLEAQNVELNLARKQALEANQLKSHFLAHMSHEMRTPLNAVIGLSDLLLKSSLSLQQEDYLRTISQSAQWLLTLINDLLDLAKIEAGKLIIDYMPVDLQQLVQEVRQMLLPSAEQKHLVLDAVIYNDVPRYITSDPLRLKQILINLINNAIKFTPSGSVKIRVMLEDEQENNLLLKVTVEDTGIGLSPTQQALLFQPYQQAGINEPSKGTGLGLFIIKQLVMHMQGEIGIASEPDKGSTFWFSFPTTVAAETMFTTAPSTAPLEVMTDCEVLVVDDDMTNLKVMTALLQDLAITVTQANHPRLAIEYCKNKIFAMIFMDMQMPELSGMETAQIIRQSALATDMPIVAVTAHALADEKRQALLSHFNDYLTKPVTSLQLVQTLNKWLKTNLTYSAAAFNTPELPLLDAEESLRLVNHKVDISREMIGLFKQSLIKEYPLIELAIREQDWTTLLDKVHKLHGASCYCGVPKLRKQLQQAEILLKQTDYIAVKQLRLDQTIQATLQALDLAA